MTFCFIYVVHCSDAKIVIVAIYEDIKIMEIGSEEKIHTFWWGILLFFFARTDFVYLDSIKLVRYWRLRKIMPLCILILCLCVCVYVFTQASIVVLMYNATHYFLIQLRLWICSLAIWGVHIYLVCFWLLLELECIWSLK